MKKSDILQKTKSCNLENTETRMMSTGANLTNPETITTKWNLQTITARNNTHKNTTESTRNHLAQEMITLESSIMVVQKIMIQNIRKNNIGTTKSTIINILENNIEKTNLQTKRNILTKINKNIVTKIIDLETFQSKIDHYHPEDLLLRKVWILSIDPFGLRLL